MRYQLISKMKPCLIRDEVAYAEFLSTISNFLSNIRTPLAFYAIPGRKIQPWH